MHQCVQIQSLLFIDLDQRTLWWGRFADICPYVFGAVCLSSHGAI